MNFVPPDPERTCLSETAQELIGPDGETLQKYYVAVSHMTRHFGGPEEGGWWYDWREVVEVRRVFGIDGLVSALERLKEEYPRARYSRGSVLGNAGDHEFMVCTTQEEIPEDTKQRPRYE
jgi:hypothetical protein